jgi:uncharacterized protein YecE (DUF72 family)
VTIDIVLFLILAEMSQFLPKPPPQTDLFGEPLLIQENDKPTPKKRGSIVTAISPTPDIIAAAQNLPAQIYLGTSSWSFAGWAGLVYDGSYSESKLAREGLTAYSTHPLLNTVSIDRTFYAPIAEADFADYARQVPPHFRFITKAPMAITSSYVRDDKGNFADSPFYFNVDYAINEFIAPATLGLKEKCGPLVFQFPPQGSRITANPDPFINRLYRFLNALPPGIRYAVEVRDPQLLTDRFFKCLNATNVRFCIASHAKMPSPATQIVMIDNQLDQGDFICRWSLHAGFKYEDAKSRYFPFNKIVDEDIDSRQALAGAIARASRQGKSSFVTINNKAEGSAPLSVLKLAEAIGSQS